MIVKVRPKDPGARISIARTAPEEDGSVMIDFRELEVARSHGFDVVSDEPVKKGAKKQERIKIEEGEESKDENKDAKKAEKGSDVQTEHPDVPRSRR